MATLMDYFPLKKKRGRTPKVQSNTGRKCCKLNADASTIARNDTQEPPQQSPVPPKVGSSQQTTGKRSRTNWAKGENYEKIMAAVAEWETQTGMGDARSKFRMSN